jgi:hypothetical protein
MVQKKNKKAQPAQTRRSRPSRYYVYSSQIWIVESKRTNSAFTSMVIRRSVMNKAYQLEATCLTCKGEAYVLAQPDLVHRYQDGELVQNVWPDTSTEYREVIIGWRTGAYICPMCALDDE